MYALHDKIRILNNRTENIYFIESYWVWMKENLIFMSLSRKLKSDMQYHWAQQKA